MKRFNIFILLLSGIISTSWAAEAEFSYNTENKAPEYYGTSKKETYDVAILLDNPSLVGAQITGLSVNLPGSADLYNNCSVFITKELKLGRVNGNRVNVPDICSVPAILENGMLKASFDEPYRLTEDPVYIGYSLDIEKLTEASEKPIAVVQGTNPGGFWLHTSRTNLKWANYPQGVLSAMSVGLKGDFTAVRATPVLDSQTILLSEQENEYSFSIVNGSVCAINDIDFDWSVAGIEGSSSYTFGTPVKGVIGASGRVKFNLPPCDKNGQFRMSITLRKINGEAISETTATDTSDVIFTPSIPVMRPLVEEYTGLWCGWCPRGYAALEYLDEECGHESFVAAAWHNDDPMEIIPRNDYPNSVVSWPLAFINRDTSSMDPGDIYEEWCKARTIFTDFNISCDIDFTDSSKTTLKATSYVNSIADKTEQYKIGYLVVADGLKDPSWFQSNNYSSSTGISREKAEKELPGRFFELFYDGTNPLRGLVYNDVVVNAEYYKGIDNSLPDKLAAHTAYKNEVTFDISNIRNIYDKAEIPILPDKIRVLAFILRKNGEVANSCSSGYPGDRSQVDTVESETIIESTSWYDLQGLPVAHPAKGLFIRIDNLSNGKIKISKIVM